MAKGHHEILSLYCLTAGKTAISPIPPGVAMARRDTQPERSVPVEEKKIPFTYTHKKSLQRRGLDPKDYVFVKETYGALYVRNVHTGVVKIINKCN